MLPIDDLQLPPIRVIDGVATFCVAHREPLTALPDWVTLIDTSGFSSAWNPYQVGDVLAKAGIAPLDPLYLANESLLLLEALVRRQRPEIDRVCMMLHRKFVAWEQLGIPASNFPNMRMLAACEVEITPQLLFGTGGLLTTQPIDLPGGVFCQYAFAHHFVDFLRLSEAAVETGCLRQEDFFEFCQSKLLIAGPLIGLTPVDLFLRCVEIANPLILHLNKTRYSSFLSSDPYQCRALSFFLERLISFELLRGLADAGVLLPMPGGGAVPLQIEAFGWLMTLQEELHPKGVYEVGNR